MRRRAILFGAPLVAAVAAALFFFLPHGLDPVQASAAQPTGAALIEKGRYLATAGDCAACHTAPGGQPLAGGVPFALPFGTLYSPNITPDRATGIGGWSDAEFVRAMRHGVGRDGRDLYPALPYASYARVSTDDLLAIRAYLATVPPVRATAPANTLAFPFNQRWLMRGWKLLFLPRPGLAPVADRSPEWNRGAYLVQGLAHCGECHTPRNLLFGPSRGRAFAGAVTQGWHAYNITSDARDGIGDWPVDEIATYLRTGRAVGRGAANGPMAEAVTLSLSHLTGADLRAMAVYLKSLPPKASRPPIDPHPPALAAATVAGPAPGEPDSMGRRLFAGACASCHGWDGSGVLSSYAGLAGMAAVNDPAATNLIQLMLHGNGTPHPDGQVYMPAFGRAYSDAEIAAVANYAVSHFGNKTGRVTPRDVAAARAAGH